MNFSGELDNITSLLFHKENAPKVTSKLNLTSKKLIFEDFTNLFAVFHKDKTKKRKKPKSTLKSTLKEVYNKFNPQLHVAIDAFGYDNINVHNFRTGFHFENEHKLYLEDTGFDFYDGSINLNAHIDIIDPNETLFAVAFETNKLDIEKVLESFDFFDINVLKQAERIGGDITLDAFLEGDIDDDKGLKKNTLQGHIRFDIEETEIKKFTPITKITDIVFKKHQFDDIRFAPIEDSIYISNNTVEIPQLEIQSTNFDLFVEGHLGFEDVDTNIWISVPLGNLKHKDVSDIPDKKGYIDAGKKIFIEAKSDETKKIKYKLHLTNKELYKEKNILGQYKKRHKEERKMRRKHKRDKRVSASNK